MVLELFMSLTSHPITVIQLCTSCEQAVEHLRTVPTYLPTYLPSASRGLRPRRPTYLPTSPGGLRRPKLPTYENLSCEQSYVGPEKT